MRRYFINEKLEINQIVTLQGELFHHIVEVCRLQERQHFEFLNESGKAYFSEIISISKKIAKVQILEVRSLPTLKTPLIYLFLSFPKVSTFESIVEKSVEMGVKAIVPFLSDYSFYKSLNQFPHEKLTRWKKIILQATQQSARSDLLQINEVQTLAKLLESFTLANTSTNELNVIAYEGEAPMTLKSHLAPYRSFQENNTSHSHTKSGSPHPEKVNLFVGSEGGFSTQEIDQFKKLDLIPVTLGDQILRVETACMTLVSSIKYEFEL